MVPTNGCKCLRMPSALSCESMIRFLFKHINQVIADYSIWALTIIVLFSLMESKSLPLSATLVFCVLNATIIVRKVSIIFQRPKTM